MLKEGQAVRIKIKRPSRWAHSHVQAFAGVLGFIKEIKPDNGNNNILVSFPTPIVAGQSLHHAFHFLAEDLIPETEPVVILASRTQQRKMYATNMLGLYQIVENHGWTITWDKTSDSPRGVIWNEGDGLAGFFNVTNGHVDVTVEDTALTDWW